MKELYRFVRSHALGGRAPLRAFANILFWQIRARMSRTAVRCRWIDGSILMVRRGMTGATGNLYVGLHEFADMGFALHFLRAGDLFVDVGANVGSYTVLASRLCGARSIAFEPDPGTCQNLADNIRANNIQSLVSAHESAVGADIGQISFSMDKDTVNHIIEAGDRADSVRSVAITTLDAALAGLHPALIKIDVEGHEPAVVHGAQEILAGRRARFENDRDWGRCRRGQRLDWHCARRAGRSWRGDVRYRAADAGQGHERGCPAHCPVQS